MENPGVEHTGSRKRENVETCVSENKNSKRTKMNNSFEREPLVSPDMSLADICQALQERGVDTGDVRSILVARLEKEIRKEMEIIVANNNNPGTKIKKEVKTDDEYVEPNTENVKQEQKASDFCYVCQEFGHNTSTNCVVCKNCGIKGHVERDCDKKEK